MMKAENGPERLTLIDFATGAPTPFVSYVGRLPFGDITFNRCTFPPNPGVTIGSPQIIIGLHRNASFEMEWWDPDRHFLQRQVIGNGDVHLDPANLPIFHRWTESLETSLVALDPNFVEQTFVEAFDRDIEQLRVVVGGDDPIVRAMLVLSDKEVQDRGAAGRLYAEGLATALVIHLFRHYGTRQRRAPPISGGLTPVQLRRVTEFIEAQLEADLGLVDLARQVGLSTHHFGQAFKASTGVPPHKYVLQRRVARAEELLLSSELPIAEIAAAVGFSSQSHMTYQFRKLTGTTPSRFRRER
ncbi:AraC family transcriptional regulator [Inquilinus limosus]|uniref:helix-turn-helix domain-containing protein n=1 Tax=Inquilinus limosus TaxID=171674 RepID=UPI003F18818A